MLAAILPLEKTYAIDLVVENRSSYFWMLYMLVIAPADAFFTNMFGGNAELESIRLIISIALSYLIWVVLYVITKKANKRSLLIVPYLLLSLFAGFVYFWVHHIGIVVIFFVFVLWCCFDEFGPIQAMKLPDGAFGSVAMTVLVLAIGNSLYWSAAASRNEVHFNYGTGREAAAFIKISNLDKLEICSSWRIMETDESSNNYFDYNSVEEFQSALFRAEYHMQSE